MAYVLNSSPAVNSCCSELGVVRAEHPVGGNIDLALPAHGPGQERRAERGRVVRFDYVQ